MGDHTNARVTFRRAIEHGNIVVAEITTRELGRIGLAEALELTALIAQKDWERGRRASARWLARWIGENPRATLDEALVVAGLLAGLGDGQRHGAALSALRDMAEQATGA